MAQQESHRQTAIETLREIIDDIHVAMLTTVDEGEKLRSRPMVTARHPFDGDLWLYTIASEPTVLGIRDHAQVNVAYESPSKDRYVSASGAAELVQDAQKLELLWHDELRPWFPEGLTTPGLALLRVAVEEAAFWDAGVQRQGGFLSAMVSWRPSVDHVHEKIEWPQTADPLP